jgi:hypothetical protein
MHRQYLPLHGGRCRTLVYWADRRETGKWPSWKLESTEGRGLRRNMTVNVHHTTTYRYKKPGGRAGIKCRSGLPIASISACSILI